MTITATEGRTVLDGTRALFDRLMAHGHGQSAEQAGRAGEEAKPTTTSPIPGSRPT